MADVHSLGQHVVRDSTENPQSIETLREKLSDLQFVVRCMRASLENLELLPMMAIVRDLLQEQFQFDRFGLLIATMNRRYCIIHEVVTADDMEACPEGSMMIVKHTGLERVFETKLPHYAPDIASHPEFVEDPELAELGIRSVLRLPLIFGNEVYGVMTVKSRLANHFSTRDMDVLQQVSEGLCAGIHNSKLIGLLRAQSYRDGLTGVFSRRLLAELMEQENYAEILFQHTGMDVEGVLGLAVVMVDIADFKVFNDSFGHGRGDKILLCIADMLSKAAGDDGVVCRYGGDEFVVLLPGGTEEDGKRYCQVAQNHLLVVRGEEGCNISMNMGVAAGEWELGWNLVGAADAAMYDDKHRMKRKNR